MTLNKVFLLGRLGADPTISYTQQGNPVCNFSIATSDEWKDKKTGEKKEKTEWHRLVAFNKLAEISIKYLNKGSQIFIAGKLQTRSYEKDGGTRYITEILVNELKMLDSKREKENEPQQDYSPPQGKEVPPGIDDDIPF